MRSKEKNYDTVELPNNGHSGDRPLVHCREVVPNSEVMPCMLQSVGGKQLVRSTEVAHFSECPLSEVPLYIHVLASYRLKYAGI